MNTISIIICLLSFSSIAQKTPNKPFLTDVIVSYEKALNNGNTERTSQLFTNDAVLILQGSPTCIGIDSIKAFYTKIFQFVDFDLKFNIAEVIQISSDWAFIRTTTHSSNSLTKSEEAHEIFLLNRTKENTWKIARYSGSSSL